MEKGPGTGPEVISGEDVIALVTREKGKPDAKYEMLFPSFHQVRCTRGSDGAIHYAAARSRGGPLEWGSLGMTQSATTEWSAGRMLLASQSIKTLGVASSRRDGPWHRLRWDAADHLVSEDLTSPINTPGAIPLPWSDGTREGICWRAMRGDKKTAPSFAYQSTLATGSKEVGLLEDDAGRLTFSLCPLGR